MKNKTITNDSVYIKNEDIPSIRQLRQAALRLHKCASIYAKVHYSTKEGFNAKDLASVADFLDFFIRCVEHIKLEDKENVTDPSLDQYNKLRLCSICKTGHINYHEEVNLILDLAKKIEKESR